MRISFSLVMLLLVLYGCSSSKIGYQYDFQEPNVTVNSNTGYLKIFTMAYHEKGDYADDPTYKVFKGYTIYARNSEFVRDVEKSYQEPRLVKLNEGNYIVVAELYKNIVHSFQIKIEKGKILEIDKSMLENPLSITQIN